MLGATIRPVFGLATGPLRDALTAALGFFTGLMSALFGIGGAIVSTPGIRALGVSAAVAIGTTLPAIIPGAASGTYRYAKQHLIDWPVVARAGSVGAACSIAGAIITDHIPGHGHFQQLVTAALLGFSGFKMFQGLRRARAIAIAIANRAVDSEATPAPMSSSLTIVTAVGAGAGFLSGFLGVGGGVFMVPAFTQYAGLNIRRAIATSLACVGFFAIPGTITHAIQGGIDWRVALWITATVIPGAQVGAYVSTRASDHRLQICVAVLLSTVAVVYGVSEIMAL